MRFFRFLWGWWGAPEVDELPVAPVEIALEGRMVREVLLDCRMGSVSLDCRFVSEIELYGRMGAK